MATQLSNNKSSGSDVTVPGGGSKKRSTRVNGTLSLEAIKHETSQNIAQQGMFDDSNYSV